MKNHPADNEIQRLLNDPTTSGWLRAEIRNALNRPNYIDALHDAELLEQILHGNMIDSLRIKVDDVRELMHGRADASDWVISAILHAMHWGAISAQADAATLAKILRQRANELQNTPQS